MYYPSNNWYVVRQNMVGVWQVEAQQGCFFIRCPSRYKANKIREYLMYWLTNCQFYRFTALAHFIIRLHLHEISFEEFFRQVKIIHCAAKEEF